MMRRTNLCLCYYSDRNQSDDIPSDGILQLKDPDNGRDAIWDPRRSSDAQVLGGTSIRHNHEIGNTESGTVTETESWISEKNKS